MTISQRTVAEPIRISGIGLHSGQRVTLTLSPGLPDSGVVFVRADLPGHPEIPARSECVVDTSLATTLGLGSARIGTVEHLLAAIAGLGLDNVRAAVDGPEVPIMDGSSAPFCDAIQRAGMVSQSKAKRFLAIKRPVAVRDGDKRAEIEPASALSITASIDFRHPLITHETFHAELDGDGFEREIAPARTFGFLRDIQKLEDMGLARGGSLDNAIVVDERRILNPGGLRFPDEFVRHKILDVVGDLALLGAPVMGHVVTHKSGHALNQALVAAVLADPSAYEWVNAGRELERWLTRAPDAGEVSVEVA